MEDLTVIGKRPPRPPRKWIPAYLEQAEADARRFLNPLQYEHAKSQMLALCEEEDPSHPILADVDAIDDFHELRDKHGVLGKINLRIYFWICHEAQMIVVLGAWKKESEGQVPARIVRRMKGRKRRAQALIQAYVSGGSKKLS